MPSVAFSLTEHVIIDPVLHKRAALLNDPESPPRIGNRIWHFVEAEIIARVSAVFISVFAAADACTHLSTGLYKGGYLLLGKCCKIRPALWNKSEVYEHFQRAAFFAGITLVGSVVGAIWPGIFKYFLQSPSSLYDGDINNELPGAIRDLTLAVQTMQEQDSLHLLETFWRDSNLSSKHWFVQGFNQGREKFDTVRKALSDIVYRPIVDKSQDPYFKQKVKWMNEREVECVRDKTFDKGFFFHATSEKALESILKARKLEVRHEKAYRGAFVSTRPELSFGPCVLAFKRNIERLSSLGHGFTLNQKTYWAGFSRDIPVSESTLAYIILNSQSVVERQALEQHCEEWTGRKVNVILIDDVQDKLKRVRSLGMGIPMEWPEEGEQAGQKILKAMKLALAIPQRIAVQPQMLAVGY